jgi:hypothetical protein
MSYSTSVRCGSSVDARSSIVVKISRYPRANFKKLCLSFVFTSIVLLTASIATPDLHADDVYPNCIVTAIDPNSGVITSQETGTGKILHLRQSDGAE